MLNFTLLNKLTFLLAKELKVEYIRDYIKQGNIFLKNDFNGKRVMFNQNLLEKDFNHIYKESLKLLA